MIRHNSFKESWMTSKHIDFFSFEGTCTPTSLYYCLIKHCLKHCVCFYDMAIPQEILKIVCLYQVHVSLLFWSDELSELSSSLSSVVDSVSLCLLFFGPFANEEIIYRSLHFTCFRQWLVRTQGHNN